MRFKEMDTKSDRLMYEAAYQIYRPLAKLAFGLEVFGREHIPAEGPVIIASNHRTSLDTIALPYAVVPRHLSMVARDDFFSKRMAAAGNWLFDHLEVISIGRRDFSTDNLRAIDTRLDKGRAIAMYPEETRGNKQLRKTDRGPHLGDFKPGVASFARRHEAPTIPAAVSGLDNPFQKDQRRIARVAFGRPIDPPGRGKEAKTEYLEELRYQINSLYISHLAALR